MPIESVMPSNHLILCHRLLPPSLVPSIRVFSNESVFQSGSQSIGTSASASVLPVNIQGWFPLGLTGLITLESRWLSSVFSTVIQKHQLFDAQPSLWSRPWLLFFNSSYSLVKSLSVLFSTYSNSSNNLSYAFYLEIFLLFLHHQSKFVYLYWRLRIFIYKPSANLRLSTFCSTLYLHFLSIWGFLYESPCYWYFLLEMLR